MGKKQKHTYRFDPHTLRYIKVKVRRRDKLKKLSWSVLLGIVLGVVLLVVGFQVVDSPKEKALKRELALYKRQVRTLNDRVNRANEVLTDLEKRDADVYRTLFESEPVNTVRDSLLARQESYDTLMSISHSELLVGTTKKVDDLTKRLYLESVSIDQIFKMAQGKQDRMAAMPAIMPIDKRKCKLISGFGYRYHPILKTRRMHTGVDLTAKKGTPIYATGDGVVEVAGKGLSDYSGYGVVCVINHGYGYKTLYGHMTDVKVRRGQKVKRGELVGTVGSTGLSQAPHLHYEVIMNGKKVDPVRYFFNGLTPTEYEEILELARQENQCIS
ncbi:MAG: M23 family metallopeptidase [Bacteroidales bacterium]|nr:M23 family metallopeptidase [Bacteroidales bacterium]